MSVKLWQIRSWHKFKPTINIWFTRNKTKSRIHKMPEQTWYGGEWFTAGVYAHLQCNLFAIHIMIKWWELK